MLKKCFNKITGEKSIWCCLVPLYQLSFRRSLSPGGVGAPRGHISVHLLWSCPPLDIRFGCSGLHRPLLQPTATAVPSQGKAHSQMSKGSHSRNWLFFCFMSPSNALWAVPFPLAAPLALSSLPRAYFPFHLSAMKLLPPYTLPCPFLHSPPSLTPFLVAVMFSTACSPPQQKDAKQRG